MEKQTPKTPSNGNDKKPLPAVAHWVLAGVALGGSYLLVSMAIDSGSLLLYAGAAAMFGLGIKNLVQGVGLSRNRAK